MQITQSINNENLPVRDLGDIKAIILHHTGSQVDDDANRRFLNRDDYVSAHFLVGKKGQVWQLVNCNRSAFHAGYSKWPVNASRHQPPKGNSLNWCTLGIEVNSDGHNFTKAQRDAVKQLVLELCKKYDVPVEDVFRHADIAPGRKWDVGESFYSPSFKTWGDWQQDLLETKKINSKVDWSKVSPWAREAVARAIQTGTATHWGEPQSIPNPAVIEQMLYNCGAISSNSGNGLSKERWAVVLQKFGSI